MHRAEAEGTIVTCPLHAWCFDLQNEGREIHHYRPLHVPGRHALPKLRPIQRRMPTTPVTP